MKAVHSSPVQAALDNDLAADAEEEFTARSGDDQQLDAYELRDLLNDSFARGTPTP